ncbi:hypothetical protein [Psychroflexus salis]|nr:hypothetical protein [Psychroflexus salis]
MSTLKIREELYKYIEIGDKSFLEALYKSANSYIEQKKLDMMIDEGEEDILAGRTYSIEEAKEILDHWEE